ncbi:hypothetical protein AVEN_139407-1 [Araneus ventricosus]|uniref:Uncharacterized protein n=1 Tax=Araneus ventricosus TaxID=182803 RepID=A0A4Y2Q9R9_ARAVE|nr:hypothetical protein AVEN_139407-1 [Araneus ventricosus]
MPYDKLHILHIMLNEFWINNNAAEATHKSLSMYPNTVDECQYQRSLQQAKLQPFLAIWLIPPVHHWYQCSRPGGCLSIDCSRRDQTTLTRFLSGISEV